MREILPYRLGLYTIRAHYDGYPRHVFTRLIHRPLAPLSLRPSSTVSKAITVDVMLFLSNGGLVEWLIE